MNVKLCSALAEVVHPVGVDSICHALEYIGPSKIISMDDLLNSLNERSERSKATKLWSDTLIKGLFIMTAFGRGANEQDFPLQLASVKAVQVTVRLPYFAATDCHNYLG